MILRRVQLTGRFHTLYAAIWILLLSIPAFAAHPHPLIARDNGSNSAAIRVGPDSCSVQPERISEGWVNFSINSDAGKYRVLIGKWTDESQDDPQMAQYVGGHEINSEHTGSQPGFSLPLDTGKYWIVCFPVFHDDQASWDKYSTAQMEIESSEADDVAPTDVVVTLGEQGITIPDGISVAQEPQIWGVVNLLPGEQASIFIQRRTGGIPDNCPLNQPGDDRCTRGDYETVTGLLGLPNEGSEVRGTIAVPVANGNIYAIGMSSFDVGNAGSPVYPLTIYLVCDEAGTCVAAEATDTSGPNVGSTFEVGVPDEP